MADEHTLQVNGHKFKFGLRDIIQIVVTFLAAVGLYFSLVQRTNKNTDDISNVKIEQERMNREGTRASHETDAKQQQTIDSLRDQFNDLNHEMRNLTPKVDKIDANVLWLMGKQLEKH